MSPMFLMLEEDVYDQIEIILKRFVLANNFKPTQQNWDDALCWISVIVEELTDNMQNYEREDEYE